MQNKHIPIVFDYILYEMVHNFVDSTIKGVEQKIIIE